MIFHVRSDEFIHIELVLSYFKRCDISSRHDLGRAHSSVCLDVIFEIISSLLSLWIEHFSEIHIEYEYIINVT